jgi:hydrogenase 3 maturation protease
MKTESNSLTDTLETLSQRLIGTVVIVGMGNTLRSDDGVGSLLASALGGSVSYIVYEVGVSLENYLGKIVKDKPDSIVLVDAARIGRAPGECGIFELSQVETASFFTTHNASLSMALRYLQKNLKADIILLLIQPQTTAFGDTLSPEVSQVLRRLREWFSHHGQKTR